VQLPAKKPGMTSDDEIAHNTSTSAGIGPSEETTEVIGPPLRSWVRHRRKQPSIPPAAHPS
jgi:hypothetical protein